MYHRLKVLHCVPISQLWNDLQFLAWPSCTRPQQFVSASIDKLREVEQDVVMQFPCISAYKSMLSRFSPSPANCKEARYLLPGVVSSSVLAKHTKVCVHFGNLFSLSPLLSDCYLSSSLIQLSSSDSMKRAY